MALGVFLVIAACFFWGLVFAIPNYLASYNPIEIALGRYLFFGLFSLLLLAITHRHLIKMIFLDYWKRALLYSIVCTFISYTALVACIKYATPSIAALIFGMTPVTIPLYGNWYKKEYKYQSFLLPAGLMIIGIILTNLNAFHLEGDVWGSYFFGLISGLSGLAAWTWYTVHNFHTMQKVKELSSNDWVVMMGVTTFFLTLFFTALYVLFAPDISRLHWHHSEWPAYLVGSALLGITSSWLAFYLWNVGNRHLPVSFAGQLTVFEMIFGLLLVYLLEAKVPPLSEVIGIFFMLLGVYVAFKVLHRKSPAAPI